MATRNNLDNAQKNERRHRYGGRPAHTTDKLIMESEQAAAPSDAAEARLASLKLENAALKTEQESMKRQLQELQRQVAAVVLKVEHMKSKVAGLNQMYRAKLQALGTFATNLVKFISVFLTPTTPRTPSIAQASPSE
ncbi:hypothetical protein PHYPSEUDO_012506 [Phytophthora pseudosyringae]|uniref:Uncharacterized protein n=1 Tax=Phytophthora pseudosyringae TaxID=221518 RepID=A0A8T1W4X4_9STRA|nr:hypothetical protein PHYPSEUDO_012506 [Phytophthora pseudosyringae]